MGREQLNWMPETLDQAALAVRTTLVVIGTRREGSNFRPLRCHASAGAIFQKARTIDHAGGEIALLAPGCDLSQRRGIGLDGQHLDQCPPDLDDRQPSMEGFCIHMSIMPSPHFRAANMGSIVQRREMIRSSAG